nr:hypothetical protein CFP56_73009 [Quercus suber]
MNSFRYDTEKWACEILSRDADASGPKLDALLPEASYPSDRNDPKFEGRKLCSNRVDLRLTKSPSQSARRPRESLSMVIDSSSVAPPSEVARTECYQSSWGIVLVQSLRKVDHEELRTKLTVFPRNSTVLAVKPCCLQLAEISHQNTGGTCSVYWNDRLPCTMQRRSRYTAEPVLTAAMDPGPEVVLMLIVIIITTCHLLHSRCASVFSHSYFRSILGWRLPSVRDSGCGRITPRSI